MRAASRRASGTPRVGMPSRTTSSAPLLRSRISWAMRVSARCDVASGSRTARATRPMRRWCRSAGGRTSWPTDLLPRLTGRVVKGRRTVANLPAAPGARSGPVGIHRTVRSSDRSRLTVWSPSVTSQSVTHGDHARSPGLERNRVAGWGLDGVRLRARPGLPAARDPDPAGSVPARRRGEVRRVAGRPSSSARTSAATAR